jgi:digeranylgeranylglycerophospholipid reductase
VHQNQPENNNGGVVVVGGSAAGFLTAAKVAAGGRNVRVLDAKCGLDPARRSLIVTHHFREQLRDVGASSIVNEIRRFELFTDGRSAQVALSKPDLIIERARLIPALAQEAARAGAKLSFDTRFLGLGPNSRGLRLEVESAGRREEIYADHVVGADGAATRVGRSAGWPPVETVPLVQAIVKLPKDCPRDTTRVWFVPDDTPYFYWLIPENESRGALGIIGEGSGQETKKRIERFLEKKQMEALEWQGARIPVYRKWIPVERRVGNGNVFLVGDAAAQVKVTTVGGIVTGFRGAQGVADTLLGVGSSELRALRRELATHWLIRKTMHHFEQKHYSYLVDLLNSATRESLGEIHRDHSTRLLWTVLRRQPRLILLGLRGLLMGTRPR